MSYRDLAKIYIADIDMLDEFTFWKEVSNRLKYANDQQCVYDDFFMDMMYEELYDRSESVTFGGDYVYIIIETVANDDYTTITFLKDDLEDYNRIAHSTDNIKHTYIDR